MDAVTSKKLRTLINVAYLALFVAAFYVVTKYFLGTLFPFILALAVAAMLQRPKRFLIRHKIPKGPASVLLSLLVYLVLIGLVVLGSAYLVGQIRSFITYFTDQVTETATLFDVIRNNIAGLGLMKKLPETARNAILGALDNLKGSFASGEMFSTITNTLARFASTIGGAVSAVPTVLISFVVGIVATCFITIEYDEIKAFILRQFRSPRGREKAIRTKHLLTSSFGKMVRAYALIMLITGTEISIGLGVLKLLGIYDGQILLVAVLTAIVDIIPVLGTGTVLIPWAVISFVSGKIGLGIGLLVMYVVILVIRQILEPKLVAGQIGISPVVTIISMFVGARYFGIIGFFTVPLSVIMVKLLNDERIIHILARKEDAPLEETPFAESEQTQNTAE